jgi:transcriptional regulator with XRE-family HTH domain
MRDALSDADHPRTIGCAADLAAVLRRHIRVREVCTGRRFGRTRLAEALGVSASTLYAYLGGRTLPPPDLFDRLLDVITVPAGDRAQLAIARDNLAVRARLRQGIASSTASLPPDPPGFIGRTEELAELNRMLATGGCQPPPVTISIVSGAAGVGKTRLALRWAHRVRDRFSDGQLYLDLRGSQVEPMSPGQALGLLLGSLGDHSDVPRAARLRTLVADQRVLLLLDDVHCTDQIRDLLPCAGHQPRSARRAGGAARRTTAGP